MDRHDHALVAVRVSPGVGSGMILSLRVDGVSTNGVAFAYAPPVLHGVLPSVASAEGDTLTLVGANFGVDDPSEARNASTLLFAVRRSPSSQALTTCRQGLL